MRRADFYNPLTTELFDRTPEQREKRTGHVMYGYRNFGNDWSHAKIQAEANRSMYRRFLSELEHLIGAEAKHLVESGVVNAENVSDRYMVAKAVGDLVIQTDLGALDEAIGFPNLERIAVLQEQGLLAA